MRITTPWDQEGERHDTAFPSGRHLSPRAM
jgi:hypothetical protein